MRLSLYLFFCLHATSMLAQGYQPVFSELTGLPLIDSVVANYKPAFVLDFANSRDTMFARIDNRNDSLYCVYTGYGIPLNPNQDPTQAAFALGINTEHTWPQAFGASSGRAQADMHHLFPTREDVNAARANLPFGELADNQTQRWYRLGTQLSSMPTSLINEYSEWRNQSPFEPREDHKGDVARAMFYFYTVYWQEAVAADPNYFVIQRQTLCQWHNQDPVDEREWTRTWAIAAYQDDKPNPFILDCTLATRCYCPEFADTGCFVADNTPALPAAAGWHFFPNPAAEGRVSLMRTGATATALQVQWVGAAGNRQGALVQLPGGSELYELDSPPPGYWWCVIRQPGEAPVYVPLIVVP